MEFILKTWAADRLDSLDWMKMESSYWGTWEPELIEGGYNDEFLDALENKELSLKDVPCIIEFGQNWILSNPLKKTIHKEPSYLFVSHEDCALVPIKETNQFVFGQILLRIFAQRILDVEFFSEVYLEFFIRVRF
ncbi:hypothetical protein [Leptospira stimsonii]|uniref:hypothetical protein n=1 Tax=Leptospira stimsonii TaxID=2202203 RepID=UPI001F4ECEB2|nr:hypothetical protein [Leptospira stimsonii]